MNHKEPWTYFNDHMSEKFGILDADGKPVQMTQENAKHIVKCVNAFALLENYTDNECYKHDLCGEDCIEDCPHYREKT